MSETNTVIVKILDKEYQVTCPPEEENALVQAARHLDKQMREIRTSGKVIGLERIAVMVALNNTYEMLQGGGTSGAPSKATTDGIKHVTGKVEEALQRLRQLEIN